MEKRAGDSTKKKLDVKISEVRAERQCDAFGLGTGCPRLSWVIDTNCRNWHQAGYEIKYYGPNGELRGHTGRVDSGQSIFVSWPFNPLASRERLTVRVRAWGSDGFPSKWSQSYPIEIGLLDPDDWTAQFITPNWDEDLNQAQPSPFFRREFNVHSPVDFARLYITALGVYEAQLNGIIIGDQVMPPGWTSYSHRLRYQTFDVTSMLHEGRNAIGAIVGDGWFRGRLGFNGGRRNIFGNHLALCCQLEIHYTDGTIDRIITDGSWSANTGPILSSDIYDGETYDARLEQTGWSKAGFQDDDWKIVRTVDWDYSTLEANRQPAVRRVEEVSPNSISTSPSGRTLVDFGQNVVGRVRLKVKGPAGHTIKIRHAEVLEKGELCVRPLRIAKATDQYTLSGQPVEVWEPRFTFHGFRYIEVENWPGVLAQNDIVAVVCHTDLKRTGWFECSDPLVNRFHENVVWSMRGNFFDIPTDCPQRDERMGWTGDIQVFTPTASFLYDVSGFLTSWLRDLAAEQRESGGIARTVVPNVLDEPAVGVAAWGDAAVIIPWVLYQRFGDRSVLVDQYVSMCDWVDWVTGQVGERRLWNKGLQFGDWLDPAAPPDRPEDAQTDRYLIATAYYAHSADLLGRIAHILDHNEDEIRYTSLFEEIRQAFIRNYATPNGKLTSDTQTAYALALEFCLYEDRVQRQYATDRLVQLVQTNGHKIGTGFIGTSLVCDALTHAGRLEDAYRLFLQRNYPSWLYPVTMGATTIWERWDSMLPDGSVNPGEMTSFNHYILGAVADWLYRFVGGITPYKPGYQGIRIEPHPGGGIREASTRHLTPYGLTQCSWSIQNDVLWVKVIIPPNTNAIIQLPGHEVSQQEVGSGSYTWSIPYKEPDFS